MAEHLINAMPELNSSSDIVCAPESDACSTQGPGSHVVENNTPTVIETPPCFSTDAILPEVICTTDIEANTPVATDNFFIDKEEAIDNIKLAISLMKECKEVISLSNLDTAVLMFREVLDDRPPTHPLHTDSMRDLASVLGVRFMYTHQVDDLKESLTLRRKIIDLLNHAQTASDNTNSAIQREEEKDTEDNLELAKDVLREFLKSTPPHALDDIIFLIQQSLPHLSLTVPTWLEAVTTLVDGLYARFNHFQGVCDLNEAISILQNAVKCYTKQDRQQLIMTSRICGLLAERFDLMDDISDIRTALAWLDNRNVMGTETYTGIPQQVKFASQLHHRFAESGSLHDLNTAVALYREGIAELPPGCENYASVANNLACALSTRFEQVGQQSDLDEAIFLHRQALEVRFPSHPDRPGSLNNLANELLTRFQHGGQRCDLNEAISLHRQALALFPPPDPHRPASLNNLAAALAARFQEEGQPGDLDDAISLHRQALELKPPHHPDHSKSLNNLALDLQTRFEQRGQPNDLDEAISLFRQALKFRPPPHPARTISLNGLASALLTRFRQGGQQSDLDEAIFLHRQVLELRQSYATRPSSLNNLASALATRFRHGGSQGDLDEAIMLHKQVLELLLPPNPLRLSSLNNLANTLQTRYEQRGQQNDLDDAISLYRQAIERLSTFEPNRHMFLNNLANALKTRFDKGDQQSDLDEAISLHSEALDLQSPLHPLRSSSLNNLAAALLTRTQKFGGQHDSVDRAVSLYRQALELRLPPHTGRSTSLNNLANALLIRFDNGGQQSDLDEAMSLLAMATQYPFQPPSQRLRFAEVWAEHADRKLHSSALVAYEVALQTLPQVAALSLDVESRQKALTADTRDGLVRNASICAIRSGNFEKAIEFLEAGRSIFWSQALSLRSPFDQLRNVAPEGPELADRLQYIGNALDTGSHRDVSADILDNRKKLSIDEEASRLNRLNEEWAATISKVRKLSGFKDFLSPPRLSSLQSAASKHPIIILVANDEESHCLVMTSTTINHIPLPNLPTPILKALVQMIRIAVSQLIPMPRSFIKEIKNMIIKLLEERRGISFQTESELGTSDDTFKFVLGILWDELVKPIIELLDIKKSDKMPILQWCLTGHFTFLPVHAAGLYDDDNLAIECAPDYFISLYTPTIGTLLAEPEPTIPAAQTFQMMAVIQSTTLPSTKEELAKIRQHVSQGALIELGVPGSPAYVEDVASRLPTVSVVHFACHGNQDILKPLESGLRLDNGLLQISRIMKEKIPNGSLAFLCACETAMGDERLPDEAISLGASLLFSGFRRVVATMWAMMDQDGPVIADAFYRELFRGPNEKQALEPDVTKSAYALHMAVKELRSQKVMFRRWVPFIYMGK